MPGTVVTCALGLFLMFCAVLLLTHSAAPHLGRSTVPCYPRCHQTHLVSENADPGAHILMQPMPHSQKNVQGCCKCLFPHQQLPGLSTSPSLKRCPSQWQCPVIIFSWFQLKFRNSLPLLADNLLRMPLAQGITLCKTLQMEVPMKRYLLSTKVHGVTSHELW